MKIVGTTNVTCTLVLFYPKTYVEEEARYVDIDILGEDLPSKGLERYQGIRILAQAYYTLPSQNVS